MGDKTKHPDPVDIHVGVRIRLRRMQLGINQETLANHLGITFQQVQKYEKGMNRVSASRLQGISDLLATPISFFFENASQEADRVPTDDGPHDLSHFLTSNEAIQLNRAFAKIGNKLIKQKILALVKTLANEPADEDVPQT